MGEEVISTLAPRLKQLTKGEYARGYITKKKKLYTTPLHQLIAEVLDSLAIRYDENVVVTPELQADFSFNDTLIFIDREITPRSVAVLRKSGKKSLLLQRDSLRSDLEDTGIRIIELGERTRLQTIFLDDPSFNFDYAHILPKTEKCSVMHGHTSSVLVEIVGRLQDGMVVDFSEAKRIVREAIRSLDHKLLISEKYVKSREGSRVGLAFKTVHGDFSLVVPKETTFLLSGEATNENMAKEILDRIGKKMPPNVTAVGVYVYEGLNKGSHILLDLHRKRSVLRKKR
jgi:6-pyruvoyltetrahydropterin/6-carboxytetrahydropterin synthase